MDNLAIARQLEPVIGRANEASLQTFATGIVNGVFAVSTDSGEYVIRRRNGNPDSEAISAPRSHELHVGCWRQGAPLPEPIGGLVDLEAGTFQVLRRAPGITKTQITPKEAEALGAAIASFHAAAEPFKDYIPKPNIVRSAKTEVTQAAGRIVNPLNIPNEAAYLGSLAATAHQFLQLRKKVVTRDLPKGVVHFDTNPGNVLFDENGAVTLLDIDQAKNASLIVDIANAAYYFAVSKEGINHQVISSIVSGYETQRPLTEQEHQTIPDMLGFLGQYHCTGDRKLQALGKHDPHRLTEVLDKWRVIRDYTASHQRTSTGEAYSLSR